MTPVSFMSLFVEFQASSWQGWRSILARLGPDVREFWAMAGRGSGKSRIAAVLACCFASRPYPLAPGENVFVGVFAPDRRQAGITFKYIVGLLRSVPALEALIVDELKDSLELSNGIIVEVITASTAAPRGRAYSLAVVEEAAFLSADDQSANPGPELVRALRPALARVPGSLLCVVSSPYSRRGILWDAWRKYHGQPDGRVVFVQQPTLALNPLFDSQAIATAFVEDEASARAEYGAEFRSDVSALLDEAALMAVVPAGVRARPANLERDAKGHFDAATGSGEDAAALGIAWTGEPAALAVIRQWKPPFDPSVVIAEAAGVYQAHGVTTITIDKYAPGLVTSMFQRHGIRCVAAERDTSGMFIELLALINCQGVRLLEDPVLLAELRRLERKPGIGGRETVGHPPRGHDDTAAAAAAALVAAAGRSSKRSVATLDPPDDDDGLLTWCPLYH